MKIAIASGKGGTGKTFLTTNLFHVMRTRGQRVAIVDCDAEVPNAQLFVRGEEREHWAVKALCPEVVREVCTLCGECARGCAFHAITCIPAVGYIKILADLCHGCGACLVECPERAIREGWKELGRVTRYACGEDQLFEARINEGQHSPVGIIRDAIRRAEETSAEYILLDAPPGCSCPFVHTVKDADRVVLITEPTPFGLSDLRHTVAVLRQIGKPFGVVINRADLGDGSLREWLLEEKIPLLAELPYSAEIATRYACGEVAAEHDSRWYTMMEGIAQKLLAYEDSDH